MTDLTQTRGAALRRRLSEARAALAHLSTAEPPAQTTAAATTTRVDDAGLLLDGNLARWCLIPADSPEGHRNTSAPWEWYPIYTSIRLVEPEGGGTRFAPAVLELRGTSDGQLIVHRMPAAHLAALAPSALTLSLKWRALTTGSGAFVSFNWGGLSDGVGRPVGGELCENGFRRGSLSWTVRPEELARGQDLYVALSAWPMEPLAPGERPALLLAELMLEPGAVASATFRRASALSGGETRLVGGRLELREDLARQPGPRAPGDATWPFDAAKLKTDPLYGRHFLAGDVVWARQPGEDGFLGLRCEEGGAAPRWAAFQ